MFDEELIRLFNEYKRYEAMSNPFKYCQDTEATPYISMRKQQYDSQFMRDFRFKQFLVHPQYKPLIERLKVALFEEIQPQAEKVMEDSLNKVIDELNLGR